MSLKPCHECGTEVSSASKTCPKCGATTKSIKNMAAKTIRIIWIVICAFILIFVFRSCYQAGDAFNRVTEAQQRR